jgi:hypothetical protein
MNMMNRLFDLVGKTWSRAPKDVPVLTLRRGTGSHIRFTVDDTHLHFHTMGFHPNLPIKQSIVLDELTLTELTATIQQMGYEAELTSEAAIAGLTGRNAVTLLQSANNPLDGEAHLYTFTSKLWETLYPIARLLHIAEGDIDNATRQMFADSTRGKWLDYWASFFSVRRVPGESDTSLASRMLTSINSLKTNNIAIEEMLRSALLEDVAVRDAEPALFEVELLPAFISQKEMTDELIAAVKGAGIAFAYNYLDKSEEHYPAYLQDKIGKPASAADNTLALATGFTEHIYGWRTDELSHFLINQSRLNQARLGLRYVLRDEDTVKLTGYSEAVESMTEEWAPDHEGAFEETVYPKPLAYTSSNDTNWQDTDSYRYPLHYGFTLNTSKLNQAKLAEGRTKEAGTMTLTTEDGVTVQETAAW